MTNIEIEKAVLFAALTFGGLKTPIMAKLQPLHFEDKTCSEIREQMTNVSSITILTTHRDFFDY